MEKDVASVASEGGSEKAPQSTHPKPAPNPTNKTKTKTKTKMNTTTKKPKLKLTIHSEDPPKPRQCPRHQQTPHFPLSERKIRDPSPPHPRAAAQHGEAHARKQDLEGMHAVAFELEQARGDVHEGAEELGESDEEDAGIAGGEGDEGGEEF
ncbi:hypothetical protein ACMFMG_008136 [Clarireedia jacksonii]